MLESFVKIRPKAARILLVLLTYYLQYSFQSLGMKIVTCVTLTRDDCVSTFWEPFKNHP